MLRPTTVTDVATVEEFIDRYYRPDRLNREPDTRESLIASAKSDLDRCGLTLISRHDGVTGEAVWFALPKGEEGEREE